MSIIIHRCIHCGHPDIFHDRGPTCCYGAHPCSPEYGPPEVIPTWNSRIDGTSEYVEAVTPPGTRALAPNGPHVCGCASCAELYERV